MKTYSLGADLVVHVKDDLSEISIREQWSGGKRAIFNPARWLSFFVKKISSDLWKSHKSPLWWQAVRTPRNPWPATPLADTYPTPVCPVDVVTVVASPMPIQCIYYQRDHRLWCNCRRLTRAQTPNLFHSYHHRRPTNTLLHSAGVYDVFIARIMVIKMQCRSHMIA